MRIRQEMKAETEKTDRKNAFSRFRGMVEGRSRVALAAFMVTFTVSCGDDTTGRDGGNPDTGADAQTDSDTAADADSGTPAALCAQYGPGHPNRITLTLGQEVLSGSEACQERLYFEGLEGEGEEEKANFGMYVPPSYPLAYWGLKAGERRAVNFDGTGWTTMEACEMTAEECSRSFQTGSASGDASCTATIAADRPWVMVP